MRNFIKLRFETQLQRDLAVTLIKSQIHIIVEPRGQVSLTCEQPWFNSSEVREMVDGHRELINFLQNQEIVRLGEMQVTERFEEDPNPDSANIPTNGSSFVRRTTYYIG